MSDFLSLSVQLADPAKTVALNIPLLLALGLTAGVLSGFFGIGGGWVVTPVLNFLGLPIGHAVGTGLAYIFGTSLISTYRHSRHGNVSVRLGLPVVVTMMAGMKIGELVVVALGKGGRAESVIHWLYIIFLLVLGKILLVEGVNTLRKKEVHHDGGRLSRWFHNLHWKPEVTLPHAPGRVSVWLLLGIGIVGGMLAGILGLGGGVIVVPALVYLVGVPTSMAIGTSLFCIFCASPFGAWCYAQGGRVVWMPVLVMVIGAMVGAPLGVAATKYVKGPWLRVLYGFTMVMGGLAVVLKEGWNLGRTATLITTITAGGMAVLILSLAWRNRRRAAAGS